MSARLFAFKCTPKLGRKVVIENQVYRLIDTGIHRRKDGCYLARLTWQSECPTCGEPFTVTSGLSALTLNRRCPRHHRKGITVATGRPAFRRVAMGGNP